MKVVISTVMILAFIFAIIQTPKPAHAGAGDAILLLAVVGGGIYAGYYFSENYEVKQKAVVEIENWKMKFQQPTMLVDNSGDSVLASRQDRYSLNLLHLNF